MRIFYFIKKKQVELELLHNRFELLFFVFEKEEDWFKIHFNRRLNDGIRRLDKTITFRAFSPIIIDQQGLE